MWPRESPCFTASTAERERCAGDADPEVGREACGTLRDRRSLRARLGESARAALAFLTWSLMCLLYHLGTPSSEGILSRQSPSETHGRIETRCGRYDPFASEELRVRPAATGTSEEKSSSSTGLTEERWPRTAPLTLEVNWPMRSTTWRCMAHWGLDAETIRSSRGLEPTRPCTATSDVCASSGPVPCDRAPRRFPRSLSPRTPRPPLQLMARPVQLTQQIQHLQTTRPTTQGCGNSFTRGTVSEPGGVCMHCSSTLRRLTASSFFCRSSGDSYRVQHPMQTAY